MERAQSLFERLINDGEQEIDRLIQVRASEELFLDFKRSSDGGQGANLSSIDRDNLGKAISGFGNSEGGVIVWGVHCKQDKNGADVASSKFPLADAAAFVSRLEGAVSGCTVPPHIGVRSVAIPTKRGNEGFVVTLVPGSLRAPHQAVSKSQYFIRAGSSFQPASHGLLSAMFGRFAQPVIFYNLAAGTATLTDRLLECSVNFMLRSQGPVLARDLYVSLTVESFPSAESNFKFVLSDRNNWTGNVALGRWFSALSNESFRLAPEAFTSAFILRCAIGPDVSEPLRISGVCGASGAVPFRFDFQCSVDAINEAYSRAVGTDEAAQAARREFAGILLCDRLNPNGIGEAT